MDPNTAPAPDFVTSLEAMIQASSNAILDRRLGPASDNLDARIDTAIAAALDKRLGPEVGSLGNRMTSLVEQRLANAVESLNDRVTSSVAVALEQRLGPAGGALSAQITFTSAPFPTLPSTTPPKAQALGDVNGAKETKGACLPEELEKAQSDGNRTFTEKEPSRQKQGPDNTRQLLQERSTDEALRERSADKAILTKQSGDTGATGKEQPAQKQNANVSETSQTACSESAPESAPPPALSESWKHVSTSKETATIRSDGSKSTASQPVAEGLRKSKAIPRVLLEAKPDSKTAGQSSSLADTPNKRKANQKDQLSEADNTGELESSSLEEENDSNGKPTRKRIRFKLDPPGYTEGSPIQFRSNFHTACGQTRGYPWCPRIVNLHSFTEASNKEDLTMADVVATFLFNYDPLSLDAFMDPDTFPAFDLIRSESDRKTRQFVIYRRGESSRITVKVFDLHQIARTRLLTNKIVRIFP